MRQAGHLNLLTYLELLHARYRVACADISSAFLPAEMLNPDSLWQILDFMDERGITLSCLCIDGPCLWSDDPEKKAADRIAILAYVDAARRLGARCVRVSLGGSGTDVFMSDEVFEDISIFHQEICRISGENGMKIGPENQPGFAMDPENLLRLKTAVGHPAFGFVLSVGVWKYGSGRDMIRTCLPDLMHVHFPAESIIWAKDLIRRIARTDFPGAYCATQDCGRYEIARAEWLISVLRGLVAELEYEGVEPLTSAGYYCKMAKIEPPDGILDI